MNTTLAQRDASAVAALLRCGALSAEDYALACLRRLAGREPQVRAWAHLDPDQVLAAARALDRVAPQQRGPLHGVPVGIKDVILTRDMPTRYNCDLYRDHAPQVDAACVTLLRAAGALVFGKTETVELAATGRPAPTRNPHDLARTPGGSSSGSAAAVADGHVPLALATQTGGSTIRPASYCGVYGMKPTWNLVSNEGAKRFSATLDTLGWYGRSVADLALLYQVFVAEAEATPAVVPDLSALRIGVCPTPYWEQAQAGTRAAFEQAVAGLRGAGAQVELLAMPASCAGLAAAQLTIMHAEAGAAFLPEYRSGHAQLGQSFRDQVENVRGTSRRQLCDAYDLAAQCRSTFDALAAPYDAVLTPSTVDSAPLLAEGTGALVFNGLWTLLHVPCVNLPLWRGAHGMPLGLTLTGARFSDRRVLAAAAAMAAALGGGAVLSTC